MVPDHQDAAEILVNVFRIARMMDAMGGWRVDHPIQPADPFHKFGMDEELVGQAGGSHAKHPDRIVAYPDNRQIEQEYAGQDRHPGQTEGGRNHHLLGALMNSVRDPKQPNTVRAAML